jgi:D-alanyl-D-alanine carboxypeptidase/D-alanyl-D-alanine-endopeptidase (penicillin-binding protein 4)
MMKKTLLICLLIPSLAFGLSDQELSNLKQRIEKEITKSGIAKKDLGVYVSKADDSPKVVFDLNGQEAMIPASITKVITAAAVLRALPPGSKLKTQLLSDGQSQGQTLKGSLFLKGGGDPGFVSESLWFLVNAFVRSDIKTIEGDIVVDDSLFDSERFDSSRQKERVDRAYDAPTGAMSFNWNSVNIFARPTKVGSPAKVYADPENSYIQVKSTVETVKRGRPAQIWLDRVSTETGDIIHVKGTIGEGEPENVEYSNISKPDLWAGENLKAFLLQRGIQVKGKVRAGTVPKGAQVLAESESKPIEQMLIDMNKFSNNFVAEMLTKNLAVAKGGQGSISEGMKALNSYLADLKIPQDQFKLQNPSGLTRNNRLSAFAVWSVLEDMKTRFEYQPELASSFPIAGIDGTLRSRMKRSEAERRVRAKTGFLTGVVSLAGYAGRKDGVVLPFVFIYNGNADEGRVRSLFDRLSIELVE